MFFSSHHCPVVLHGPAHPKYLSELEPWVSLRRLPGAGGGRIGGGGGARQRKGHPVSKPFLYGNKMSCQLKVSLAFISRSHFSILEKSNVHFSLRRSSDHGTVDVAVLVLLADDVGGTNFIFIFFKIARSL